MALAPGPAPDEPVHPAPPPGGQQRHERLPHDQPQGHQRAGDQDVDRDDPDGGVGDVPERHRPGERRRGEIGHVGGEGARDEPGGDQRPARGPVTAQPGEHGGGMAQSERQRCSPRFRWRGPESIIGRCPRGARTAVRFPPPRSGSGREVTKA